MCGVTSQAEQDSGQGWVVLGSRYTEHVGQHRYRYCDDP